ncbi:MAG: coenzyme F420-0:L-glutamate ligase [Archaeoglobi archaeon]|nr:coenzyme F420-0:L-glutamate ligase [Archaeoglobi archaeon]
MIRVFPVTGIPEVREGDRLGELLSSQFSFEDGDVVAVCSTVVSKAEGRFRRIDEITPTNEAIRIAERLGKDARLVQAVLDESEEVLIDFPILLTKARFGNICINAGIDTSNVREGYILLPPENPDESAERIRNEIAEASGKSVGVVVTDTNGRCFRKGVVGFAVGIAGVKAMRDWRGERDIYGRELEVTVECVADEIAAFANLLMGEGGEGIPAVVFRGLSVSGEGRMDEIYRSEEEDVIRRIIREWREKDTS